MDEAREYLTLLSERARQAIDDGLAPANSKLVLCSYGENLRPRIEHFRPDAVSRMVEVVEKWAEEDERNIYAPWCLYAHDLARGKRGEIQDIVAVLALCADLDNDKEGTKVGIKDLPCDPSLVIETSPGNMQALFVLDRALTAEEAKPAAQGLRSAVPAADSGTGDIDHVWRIPGLTNWPKKAKRDRGRVPCRSRISQPFTRAIPIDELPRGVAKEAAQGDVEREARRVNVEHARREAWVKLKDARDRARKNGHWNEVEQYSEALHRMDQPHVYGGLKLTKGGKKLDLVGGEVRHQAYFRYGKALAQAGMTRGEVIALVRDTPHWKSKSAEEGRGENPNRFIAKIAAEAGVRFDEQGKPAINTGFVDPADWAGLPVPEVEWVLEGLVPMERVTALYGDGGTGKTTLALQLAVSVAAGQPFLGCEVREGRVLAFLAEDDHKSAHRALAEITEAHGLGLNNLRGRVQVNPCLGEDNVLMEFDKNGGATTDGFDILLKAALEFEPTLIIIDNVADVFDGNENDRVQVRRFMGEICTRLASETGAAVLLLAHPSREGLKSGSGDGGSTAWHNAVRSRLYLERHKEDRDIRVLSVKKAQYGPDDWRVELRRQGGVYVLDSDEERVVREVHRAWAAGTPLGNARNATRVPYIGDWMTKELEMKSETARILMDKLLKERRIIVVEYGGSERLKGLCTPDQKRRKPGESEVKAASESEAETPIKH